MARIRIDGEIDGVAETLRALRRIDPDLRREVPDQIKNTAGATALVNTIRQRQPNTAPLSGWARYKRRPWQPGRIRNGIRLQFRGSRPRGAPAGSWPVLRVRSTNAAQNLFELAGRKSSGRTPSGQAMIRNLESRYGRASRTIWPEVEKAAGDIENEIETIFRDYAKTVTRQLGRRR